MSLARTLGLGHRSGRAQAGAPARRAGDLCRVLKRCKTGPPRRDAPARRRSALSALGRNGASIDCGTEGPLERPPAATLENPRISLKTWPLRKAIHDRGTRRLPFYCLRRTPAHVPRPSTTCFATPCASGAIPTANLGFPAVSNATRGQKARPFRSRIFSFLRVLYRLGAPDGRPNIDAPRHGRAVKDLAARQAFRPVPPARLEGHDRGPCPFRSARLPAGSFFRVLHLPARRAGC